MRKLRRVVVCSLLSLLALSSANVAFAQPKGSKAEKSRAEAPPADVETAEQLYAKLDYDKANEVAERVVKQRNLTHDQIVRAYRVLAVTYAILDKEEQARDAFLHLLVFDPEYTVDTALGPKVSTPFVEARGQFRSLPSKPGMEVVANVRSDGGQLRVTTRDPTHIAKKVTVGYRWTSSGEYTVSTISVADATVEVAPAPTGRTRLDFYALALDERDNAVFEAGNPQVPKSAFAEAGPRTAGGNGAGAGAGAGAAAPTRAAARCSRARCSGSLQAASLLAAPPPRFSLFARKMPRRALRSARRFVAAPSSASELGHARVTDVRA